MSRNTLLRVSLLCALLSCFGLSVLAETDGTIEGELTASSTSSRPDLGDWEYTLTMSWSFLERAEMGYFDLFVDSANGNCSCEDIRFAAVPGDTVGLTDASKAKDAIYFKMGYVCEDEPGRPLNKLLRFRPIAGQTGTPGPAGTGVFTFFSDFVPTIIDYDALYLRDEFGSLAGRGRLTGDFPLMECGPVPSRPVTWSTIKSLYRSN